MTISINIASEGPAHRAKEINNITTSSAINNISTIWTINTIEDNNEGKDLITELSYILLKYALLLVVEDNEGLSARWKNSGLYKATKSSLYKLLGGVYNDVLQYKRGCRNITSKAYHCEKLLC